MLCHHLIHQSARNCLSIWFLKHCQYPQLLVLSTKEKGLCWCCIFQRSSLVTHSASSEHIGIIHCLDICSASEVVRANWCIAVSAVLLRRHLKKYTKISIEITLSLPHIHVVDRWCSQFLIKYKTTLTFSTWSCITAVQKLTANTIAAHRTEQKICTYIISTEKKEVRLVNIVWSMHTFLASRVVPRTLSTTIAAGPSDIWRSSKGGWRWRWRWPWGSAATAIWVVPVPLIPVSPRMKVLMMVMAV